MTKHSVKLASGNDVSYWSHNNSQKKTLILVHGFTGSHEGFQYLVPLLSDYRLIIPDLPGFGVSPLPHEQLTLVHLGELLSEFINTLKLKELPFLLGHSMGTMVVAETIRQRPNIANKKIILISAVSSPIKLADRRRAGAVISQLYYVASHRLPHIGHKLATSKKITRLSTNLIMTAKGKDLRAKVHEHHFNNLNYISSIGWYSRLYKEINRTGISRYQKTFEPFDLLLINGDKDSITPLSHQKKAAGLLGAKLVIIPGVGHLSHYETPSALVTEIQKFLK